MLLKEDQKAFDQAFDKWLVKYGIAPAFNEEMKKIYQAGFEAGWHIGYSHGGKVARAYLGLD